MVRNGLAAFWPVRSVLTQKGRWLANLSSRSLSSLEEKEREPGVRLFCKYHPSHAVQHRGFVTSYEKCTYLYFSCVESSL